MTSLTEVTINSEDHDGFHWRTLQPQNQWHRSQAPVSAKATERRHGAALLISQKSEWRSWGKETEN